MKNILVIGANSALAEPCIKIWAKNKFNLFLVARNSKKLNNLKKNLKDEFNADVKISVKDLSDRINCEKIKDEYYSLNDRLDILFICYGELDENKKLLPNSNSLNDYLFVNAISKIVVINSFTNNFKNQRLGSIAVVTSVAGDIGKSSNYIYGSANAMLSNYLTGLRQELFNHGVKVINIKPGLLNTPMTSNLKKNILFTNPNSICKKLVFSVEQLNKDIYLPFFWKYIIFVVKIIPKFIYNRIRI